MLSNEEARVMKSIASASKSFPYYSVALNRVRVRITKDVDTAGMDSKLIMAANSEFIDSLSDQELETMVVHEVLHYIYAHHKRWMENDYKDTVPFDIHNIAMDLEINQYLKDLPKGGYTVEYFNFPKGKCYEEYLLLLLNMFKKSAGSGNGNGKSDISKGNSDVIMDGYSSSDEDARIELEQKVEEAIRSNNAGDDTSVANLLRKIPKKRYNWRSVFKRLVSNMSYQLKWGFTHLTRSEINEELVNIDTSIIHPAWHSYESKLNLVIGIDTSGSMGTLTEYMYRIIKSIADVQEIDYDITILECDTQITKVINNFDLETSEVEGSAGGGTDMGCIAKWIKDNKKNPDLIIVMTDNYTDWNPVMFREKTAVLTTNVSEHCPYKQFYVDFEEPN